MAARKTAAKSIARLSPRVEFKEGDAIIRISPGWAADQDRGLLVFSTDGWLAICFVNRDNDCLDLSGIRWVVLPNYRLATPAERSEILRAMVGKEFGKHRGLDYFAKWEQKLKTVIVPAIASVMEDGEVADE